jgi:hypothetical protein
MGDGSGEVAVTAFLLTDDGLPYDRCYTCVHRRDEHRPGVSCACCDANRFRLAATVPADEIRGGQSLPPGTYTFTGSLK